MLAVEEPGAAFKGEGDGEGGDGEGGEGEGGGVCPGSEVVKV
jgi:hypothetical protein